MVILSAVQSELGKPRRRCFTLPPTDFTYGMRSVCLDGGAEEGRQGKTVLLQRSMLASCPCSPSIHTHNTPLALTSWNAHYPTRSAGRKKVAERDFITLNKSAVQSGLTTAQEQMQFRATHDIRRRDDSERKSSRSNPKFPADMIFGISTR